ncbi:ParB/RepB/Spo0J family partition protein [bacterium]|nr:ParB/RepB/Spo0J family partition protein [bacterium]
MSRQALGKGLEALIPMQGNIENAPSTYAMPAEITIENIFPNPFQPRLEFDPKELDELSASIKEKGIVQPVMVRPRQDGKFELVAGERRFRAAKLAGLSQIPVIVREVDDTECLEIALIENIQRSNLNAIEAALAYHQLMTKFSLTQEDMAKRVGKDRSSVANTLRLLKLPQSVQELVKKSRISEGHARALLTITDESMLERLAEKIVRDSLSVREAERLAQGIRPEKAVKHKRVGRGDVKDPHTRQLEEELRRKLGTQVKVMPRSGQKGKIEIEYYSLEDLDRILALLG